MLAAAGAKNMSECGIWSYEFGLVNGGFANVCSNMFLPWQPALDISHYEIAGYLHCRHVRPCPNCKAVSKFFYKFSLSITKLSFQSKLNRCDTSRCQNKG